MTHQAYATYPEYLAPSLNPAVGGPIPDARADIDRLLEDQKEAMRFALAQSLPILTLGADRNGAYVVVAPAKHIYKVFGDECGQWRRHVDAGLTTEYWLGCIGHIRVFWREVKCTH
jgi:hypothetical protein